MGKNIIIWDSENREWGDKKNYLKKKQNRLISTPTISKNVNEVIHEVKNFTLCRNKGILHQKAFPQKFLPERS